MKISIIKKQMVRTCANLLGVVSLSLAIVSCGSDEETSVDCSGTIVTFAEVNTIIQSSCAKNSSCHGSGSSKGPGALLTYSQIYTAKSEIKAAVASGKMPEGSSLSSNDKSAILCWIENGASNN